MKLAIMQPYFMPYIGYFQLINAADKFILLDTVQFIRHGWIERNRVLNQSKDWLYVKVPLKKHKRNTIIQDIEIKNENWKSKFFAQLQYYKKKAPFYKKTIEILTFALNNEHKTITETNYDSLKIICSYLGIDTPISIFSKMNLQIAPIFAADEWALNISKTIGAGTYINPIGGIDIFNKEKYIQNNIKLKFLETNEIKYKQFSNKFTPHLSIIDVMMFNSLDEINEILNKYTLL